MRFKEKFFIFILAIIFILIIGFLVNVLCLTNVGFPVANNNDWIGFWGSIIGSLLGSFVTVLVFKKTIEHEYDKQKKEIVPFLRYSLLKNSMNNVKSSESITLFYEEIFQPMPYEEIDENFTTEVKKESKSMLPDIYFKLNIENIGLGAALDLKILYVEGDLVCNTSNNPDLNFTNIGSIKIDESINIEFKAYLTLNGDFNPFTGEATYFNYLKKGTYKDAYIFENLNSTNFNHLSGEESIVITLQYKTLRSEVYTQNIEVKFNWDMCFYSESDNFKLEYNAVLQNISEAVLSK